MNPPRSTTALFLSFFPRRSRLIELGDLIGDVSETKGLGPRDPKTNIEATSQGRDLTNWRQFSCICPVIDHEFRHNIVKVAVDPQGDSRVDPQTTLTFPASRGKMKTRGERPLPASDELFDEAADQISGRNLPVFKTGFV